MSKLSTEVYLTTKPGFRGPFSVALLSYTRPKALLSLSITTGHLPLRVKFTQPTTKCCLLKDETVFFFHERIL